MYYKGFIVATDGNVSVRLSENRFLVTPSGINKGYINEEHIIIVDQGGNKIAGRYNPTSELPMHLCAYHQREDISAVIHAHPPICVAFSVANIPLSKCILPEVIICLGEIPTSKYATPTTPKGAEVIKDLILKHDAIILERHGSLTVGHDLETAYNRLEMMEHVAKIILIARQLGNIKPLPKDEVERLSEIGKRINMKRAYSQCQKCGVCNNNAEINKEELIKIILEEIEKHF